MLGLGMGMQMKRVTGINLKIFRLLSTLKGRSAYFENSAETKSMLIKLQDCKTSSAFGLLNKLESRSTYFENRIDTRAQLVKLEKCTTS